MSDVKGGRVFICVPDETPGPRETECPNRLHDYPLPTGYIAASDVAMRRLRQHWRSVRCRDCGFYGWAPPAFAGPVPAPEEGKPE